MTREKCETTDDGMVLGNGAQNCGDKNLEINPPSSSGRRNTTPAPAGKWGSSTFWKDCQPKSESEDDEDDSGKKKEEANKGVPVDEMLSDDYYEQDGDDDQSDSLHHKKSSVYSGLLGAKALSSSRTLPSYGENAVRYSGTKQRGHEFGADGEFDSDEDEDVDDPEDVDFDPDFGDTQGHQRKKDDDWDADNFDEDDISDNDDIEVSDEDDVLYKKRNGRQQGGRGLSFKFSKGSKSFAGRRKRSKASFDEED